MAGKVDPEMKDLFKQAAAIASEVPESMQEAAFNRALDMLTGSEAADEAKQPPTKTKRKKITKKKANKTKQKKSKPKAKAISREPFDIHKDGDVPSLKEFLDEKKPGRNTGNIIAVIAYYILVIKELDCFSDGNIDYAYRTLKLKGRPKHLRQIIINNKNQRDLFEEYDEEGNWKLTRTGEIFVEEDLPPKADE